MSVYTIDTERLAKIERDITDYLFERHHTINKPLIMDLAYWVYKYGQRQYLQAQFDTDDIKATKSTTPKSKKEKPKGGGTTYRLGA